jgi:hypothetical protein
MAIFHDIKNEAHDISGISNPNDWNWMKIDNIWHPVELRSDYSNEKIKQDGEFIITKLLRKRECVNKVSPISSFDFVFQNYNAYKLLCNNLEMPCLEIHEWFSTKIKNNDISKNILLSKDTDNKEIRQFLVKFFNIKNQ